MFKNASFYAIKNELDFDALSDALEKLSFRPCEGLSQQSVGFVAPEGAFSPLHGLQNYALGCLRIDKKMLPASAVKQAVKERAQAIEDQQGYKPGRKQMTEIKEQVIDTLLPRALCATKHMHFMFAPGLLIVDASSASACDLLTALLVKSMPDLELAFIETPRSAASLMTQWLIQGSASHGFDIASDAQMTCSSSKASVKWSKDVIDHTQAQTHMEQGKQCVKMALSWRGMYSFTLNDRLVLSGIRALDTLNQKIEDDESEQDLDATIVLFGSNMLALMGDMKNALSDDDAD